VKKGAIRAETWGERGVFGAEGGVRWCVRKSGEGKRGVAGSKTRGGGRISKKGRPFFFGKKRGWARETGGRGGGSGCVKSLRFGFRGDLMIPFALKGKIERRKQGHLSELTLSLEEPRIVHRGKKRSMVNVKRERDRIPPNPNRVGEGGKEENPPMKNCRPGNSRKTLWAKKTRVYSTQGKEKNW